MKNTWLKLTDTRCSKLIEALESLPFSSRDTSYNQLKQELKQIKDMWKHIDIKKVHRSNVRERAKSNIRSNTQ